MGRFWRCGFRSALRLGLWRLLERWRLIRLRLLLARCCLLLHGLLGALGSFTDGGRDGGGVDLLRVTYGCGHLFVPFLPSARQAEGFDKSLEEVANFAGSTLALG
jgi:hypothetical protein